MTEEVSEIVPPQPARRSPLRRTGCVIALIVWFAILLLPCFFIVLAVQQEISITTGSAPGQLTRLWLISEADQRGLALSTGAAHSSGENAVCVQTDVRFLLWAGESEPVTYCECYERSSASDAWAFTTSTTSACAE